MIQSILKDGRNGDNCIHIMLLPVPGDLIPAGNWSVKLDVLRTQGRLDQDARSTWAGHGWIDNNTSLIWVNASSDDCTLTTPATANKAISVGRYDLNDGTSEPINNGDVSSGHGPTRDARLKPELIAPGGSIHAANSTSGPATLGTLSKYYADSSGTSQAAPHVAGLIALLYEKAEKN